MYMTTDSKAQGTNNIPWIRHRGYRHKNVMAFVHVQSKNAKCFKCPNVWISESLNPLYCYYSNTETVATITSFQEHG